MGKFIEIGAAAVVGKDGLVKGLGGLVLPRCPLAKRTNNANNATHYVKLGKKTRESSKRNYNIISPRVIIKAVIIISAGNSGMEER